MTVYDYPATQFVGGFIGSPPMNFLRGAGAGSNGRSHVNIGSQALPAPADVAAAGDVLVGIRAEYLQASIDQPAAGDALRAETVVVEPLGSHLLLTADVEGQVLKVVTRTDFPVRAGQTIWLTPEANKLRWLRSSDGLALDGRPTGG
jgi:multiple sugar transport system ATP-binding protein